MTSSVFNEKNYGVELHMLDEKAMIGGYIDEFMKYRAGRCRIWVLSKHLFSMWRCRAKLGYFNRQSPIVTSGYTRFLLLPRADIWYSKRVHYRLPYQTRTNIT